MHKFLSVEKRSVLFLVFLFFPVLPAYADTVVVNALAVDGDTLRVGKTVMKLWGVDAPELTQTCVKDFREYPCGKVAQTTLQKLTALDKLTCEIVDADPSTGMKLARCSIGHYDIGSMMIESGWAVEEIAQSNGVYASYAQKAKAQQTGLWAGEFALPWDWRVGNHFLSPRR